MDIQDALTHINEFWTDEPLLLGTSQNDALLARLEGEFKHPFPDDLKNYLLHFAPKENVYFSTIGNPVTLFGHKRLGAFQDGYSYNSVKQEAIDGWPGHWFLIGYEAGDPILVDLLAPENGIQKLFHGMGSWEAGDAIADDIGQFLLLSAIAHHAFIQISGDEDPFIDTEDGLQLIPEIAEWFFPQMKKWAGNYYEEWCGELEDNS